MGFRFLLIISKPMLRLCADFLFISLYCQLDSSLFFFLCVHILESWYFADIDGTAAKIMCVGIAKITPAALTTIDE